MKSSSHIIKLAILHPVLICGVVSCSSSAETKKESKPNIIYILADDLGYGELGCYGQDKIETPNIDKLAQKGMRFTNHYAGSPVSAPSRYMLLTGKHPGHAQIRGNDEWVSRGDVWNYHAAIADSTLEGQRPMKENTQTLGRVLKRADYTTGIVGKWGSISLLVIIVNVKLTPTILYIFTKTMFVFT